MNMSSKEAHIFGIPYPLPRGWYHGYGSIEITEDIAHELISALNHTAWSSPIKSKIDSAVAGLHALGESAPTQAPELIQREISLSKQAKINRKLLKKKKVDTKANKVSKKKVKTVTKQDPTESSVKNFISKSNIDVTSDEFLKSFEWKAMRMLAIKKYGNICQCCGNSPKNGAVINVDHIKPRKIFPDLALDITNLQILCSECNHGKGNWDQTDWK